MIRYMQLRVGKTKAIFVNGNACEKVYLWFRGYRVHQTLISTVMAKFWNKEGKK